MAFKYFKTYGRHRNRVVKTEVWVSPETNPLFSSSDSANTTAETEKSGLSNHTDLDNSLLTTSSFVLRNVSSTSEEDNGITDCSENEPCNEQKSPKSSSLFLEHSTPLSRLPRRIANCHDLKEISPLFTLDFNQQADCSNAGTAKGCNCSPSLFSDTSTISDLNSGTSCKDDSIIQSKCDSKTEGSANQDCNLQSSRELEMAANSSDMNKSSPLFVQSIADKMKDLKLLDVNVCLNSCEVLQFSQLNKSKKQANLLEKESDSLQDSTSSHLILQIHSQGDVHKNDQEYGMSPIVPPHTPVISRLDDQHLKSTGNNLSFVEALTPLRFQRKRTLSSKEKILMQCDQQRPLKFTEVLTDEILGKCAKVGEGTYGEVFKTNDGTEDVAIKVIPIEGNFTVNDEEQKSFHEIMPEIVISKELSNLGKMEDAQNSLYVCPNFIKVKRVMLIQDSYPQKLLHEWDEWKKKHKCENERPDIFPPDQYFIVFEFANGGEDLETFEFSKMEEALSVLQQIVLSLSVSEQLLQFEHRDLHWGNVLIKRTKCQTLRYKLNGKDIHLQTNGVFVNIIDFTLSRLTKDGVTVFCDLSKDADVFIGKGDYQFEVYRLMRKANKDDWEAHVPFSNVLWIRYLIDKIINSKKYATKNKTLQRNMRTFLRRVLSYNSALEVVDDDILGLNISTS